MAGAAGVLASFTTLVMTGAGVAAVDTAVPLHALFHIHDANAIAARTLNLGRQLRSWHHSRFSVDLVLLFMGLGQMLDHVGQHLPHVTVGDAVENLLAAAPCLQQASGPQETQMVGYQ